MPWREKNTTMGIKDYGEAFSWNNSKKWVKLVFLLGCYGCIFHGTGNSVQFCQNFGISEGRGVWTPPQTPPLGTPLVLPTNIRSRTEFRLFIFDSVRVITCLVKLLFFIRHGWQKWTESSHTVLFQSRSIYDRNTSAGAKLYGNEAVNQSNVFGWYSRFRDGRELVEDDERLPSKIDSKWGKHICCCWFGQKWPSNHIKNDSRIFEHPLGCSSSDSERGFGKENAVCTFFSTLLDTWAKGRSSYILQKTLSRWPMQTKILSTKLLREMRPGVLPMTPKQSDRVLKG